MPARDSDRALSPERGPPYAPVPASPDADASSADRPTPLHWSVVVPAFNESTRLPALLNALPEHLDGDDTELIVVDDGSTDNTLEIAGQLGSWAARNASFAMPTNRGKGAAVRAGVAAARGSQILFLDADNATDLEVLPALDSALHNSHAVFGSRNAPGAEVLGSPPFRGFQGRAYSRIVRLLIGTDVVDSQCGCKLFRAPVAKAIFGVSELDGFAFDAEVLHLMERYDLDVVEQPVRWTHMDGSKIGLTDPLKIFADTLRIRLARHRPRLPMIEATAADEPLLDAMLRAGDAWAAVEGGCRILMPFASSTEIDALVGRLRAASISAEVSATNRLDEIGSIIRTSADRRR